MLENFIKLPETLVEFIVSGVIAFAFIIQLFYLLFFYRRTGAKKSSPISSDLPPLSVVICARNEEQNLKEFLPLVLDQDYPNFEVIVVNDCSQDDTDIVLAYFKQRYSNFYYTTIPYDKIFTHGKKLPLTVGIKAAKNEHLVFTDADCKPSSNQWLRALASGFSEGKEIVVAHGAYERRKGFLNRLIRYDSFFIATQYIGFALARLPYMGVGRNMAYTKTLYNKVGGFRSHSRVLSGDDDLFIAEAATKNNFAVVKNSEARTYSPAVENWSHFMLQKSRHLTTAPYYKFRVKFLLGLELFSRELFYLGVLSSIFLHNLALLVLGVVLIRTTTKLIVFGRASRKLGEGRVFWSSLYLDIILPYMYLVFMIDNRLRKRKSSWK